MALPKYEWRETCFEPETAKSLAETAGYGLRFARLLVSRGLSSPEEVKRFLCPTFSDHAFDPFALPGVREAAERLWRAILSKDPILVFGDFDADGVCATFILVHALSHLGANVDPFIPNRQTEGYGLSRASIDHCLSRYPETRLLVTVDCGITSRDEVAYAKAHGLVVILTDHHEPEGRRPDADVLVNPKVASGIPEYANLCGAGVAFTLAHALVSLGRERGWYTGGSLGGELLAPAGLATVTDMVPLVGKNRLLVAASLRLWKKGTRHVGLTTLLQHVNQKTDEPDTFVFGYQLGPCINAAGRMKSAELAYQLLATEDPDKANQLSVMLKDLNVERKSTELRILGEARAQAGLAEGAGTPPVDAVVVCGEASYAKENGWHPGVIGIVASRLCELASLPAAAVALDGSDPATCRGRGSVRVFEGYDAMQALADASEALQEYGGHRFAGGFSLKPGMYARFKELFCASCARQAAGRSDRRRPLTVDDWLEPSDLTLDFVKEIRMLAPFGFGNPVPRWGLRDVVIKEVQTSGKDTLSLLFEKKEDVELPRAIWFRMGCLQEWLRPGDRLDVVFELTENTFHGVTSVELRLFDAAKKANGLAYA
ncbi:MAG: DHH family phosphoesterase [Kiritimatiellae bacterium]|nr:DHH family phosphoesterase [Kiritimatiellia bacterium]